MPQKYKTIIVVLDGCLFRDENEIKGEFGRGENHFFGK